MEKSKKLFAKSIMTIVLFLKTVLRLLGSPFIAAWNECEAELNRRPRAKNCKEFYLFSLRSYFAPRREAVAGVKKECKRSFGNVHDAK